MNKEYNLTNLKPELVEKNEPPIIVRINKINEIFPYDPSVVKPIFEILLVIDNKSELKLFLNPSK